MMEMEKIQALLKKRLSHERFVHTMNVAKECRKLAKRYGEDPQRAYFAGMVHDICKEDDRQQQYEWAVQSQMDFCPEEAASYKVWHGVAGAYFLRTQLGVTDEAILYAVRFHTIARSGMSMLEKIVYLGDMISEERSYTGVEVMRQTCYEDLNLGMLYALREAMRKQLKRNALIPHFTLEAYNEYTRMFPENTYHI
jgi:nicotinate-nucleotide adenylyltransferase